MYLRLATLQNKMQENTSWYLSSYLRSDSILIIISLRNMLYEVTNTVLTKTACTRHVKLKVQSTTQMKTMDSFLVLQEEPSL